MIGASFHTLEIFTYYSSNHVLFLQKASIVSANFTIASRIFFHCLSTVLLSDSSISSKIANLFVTLTVYFISFSPSIKLFLFKRLVPIDRLVYQKTSPDFSNYKKVI